MSLINKVSFALVLLLAACGKEEYEWQGPTRAAPFNKECSVTPLPIGQWCDEWRDGTWSSCAANAAGGITCCSVKNGCYQR